MFTNQFDISSLLAQLEKPNWYIVEEVVFCLILKFDHSSMIYTV